jgi:hypothetical protein
MLLLHTQQQRQQQQQPPSSMNIGPALGSFELKSMHMVLCPVLRRSATR